MDPDRVRAYLQISCAGLGFDIGELWWTSNKDGGSSSAIAAIEEKRDSNGEPTENREKKLRFVQLYTSKSYENRRPMLVRPTEEEENQSSREEDSSDNLEKHVLSPTLVEAISRTAQVVWAHTKKSEGLTGRSDIRLQTAVGMPVAVDRDGNMCVVVMFSPNNIRSTDNAMEYLQSISRSATSTSIPCLMPAFDPAQGLLSVQHRHPNSSINEAQKLSNVLTDDVITRFVPLDKNTIGDAQPFSIPEVHSDHSLESAPRDCFGIPMLPAVAELGNRRPSMQRDAINDAFDEASYGVWSTIMQTLDETDSTLLNEQEEARASVNSNQIMTLSDANDETIIDIDRQERLEEFASAFLDVSIFDLAEVWVPAGQNSDCLCLNSTVKSTENNNVVNHFSRESERVLIKFWSGAVGRAYSSGNPVWSFKQEIFSDTDRLRLFDQAKFKTVLAVPVFSGKSKTPAFVFCCYSFVRSTSIPFVLKFVQQALKLLWCGLDNVEPHESVNGDVWKQVAPADLGEMAADVEMHQHFMIKKRPIGAISTELDSRDETLNTLTSQVNSLENVSGAPMAQSIYTGQGMVESPPQFQIHTLQGMQSQIQNAIKSVADMKPVHQHIATNANGSKRAHVLLQEPLISYPQEQSQQYKPQNVQQNEIIEPNPINFEPTPSPLPLAQPFALPNQVMPNQVMPNQVLPNQVTQNQTVANDMELNQGFPNHMPPNPVVQNNVQQTVNNGYSAPYSQGTQMQYQSNQQTQPQTLYNEPQNQFNNNSNNYSVNNNTYSFQTIQQPQQQNPQEMTAPAQVFPMTTHETNSQSAPIPPYASPQNNSGVNGINHLPPAQNTKSRSSSGRSPKSASSKKPCRIQGCNDPASARRPYCVRHSGNRMCEHKGCVKCAQGSTRFCIAHGGGRRCTFPGCDKGARDKFFCAAHGGGKRCKFDGCNKSAVGGSHLCTAHGGGRRCSVEGCDKSAQSSTKFCVKHGGGKKCSFAGCEKVSRGRTQFCAAHGGGVRCKLAGCNRVAIGKVQLCRAHGGGARASKNKAAANEILLPMASTLGEGTFCVPLIEPVMDGYGQQQQSPNLGTDFANL